MLWSNGTVEECLEFDASVCPGEGERLWAKPDGGSVIQLCDLQMKICLISQMGVWLQRGLGERGGRGRMQAARQGLWAGKVEQIRNTKCQSLAMLSGSCWRHPVIVAAATVFILVNVNIL